MKNKVKFLYKGLRGFQYSGSNSLHFSSLSNILMTAGLKQKPVCYWRIKSDQLTFSQRFFKSKL